MPMKTRYDIVHTLNEKWGACSILFILTIASVFIACQQKDSHSASSHPMSDMNMGEKTASTVDSILLHSLVLPTSFRVVSTQRSVKPELSEKLNHINAHGYISLDERRSHKVSVRISGRIEKLYIRYNLQQVKKGDKIMDLYSPELNTYQNELLFLLKTNSDQTLLDQAEEKLRLLGMPQSQINLIKKDSNTHFTVTVYSPQAGFVFFNSSSASRNDPDNAPATDGSGMNGMQVGDNLPSRDFSQGDSQLREGNYVNKGDILFWINDLQQVWGMISVPNLYEQDLTVGSKVSIVSELLRIDTMKAQINFIEPLYQPDQKFVRARVYMPNVYYQYKINSLIDAEISQANKSILIIPYSSVLFLGKRKFVWVLKETTQGNNRIYEAREVITGGARSNMIEIKTGLNPAEEVAVDAGYLVDRESFLKPQ